MGVFPRGMQGRTIGWDQCYGDPCLQPARRKNSNYQMLMNKLSERNASPWSLPTDTLMGQLHGSPEGLTGEEAQERWNRFGRNALLGREKVTPLLLFLE